MKEKRMCDIKMKDHTLMLLARLPFNQDCTTWEECINNLIDEVYGDKN
jgi:hypothetical protein